MFDRLAPLVRWLAGGRDAADPLAAVAAVPRDQVRLIVGLGNPGTRYARTRHNVGFRVVDLLGQRASSQWSHPSALQAHVAVRRIEDNTLVLTKPTTFMNNSGLAVRWLVERLSIQPQHLLVIYDDMDLPTGSLRLRERGSAGTHNGMHSIIARLGHEQFPRLRLGIGQAGAADAREYVLGEASPGEAARLEAMLVRAADAAELWATAGATAAMNRFNA